MRERFTRSDGRALAYRREGAGPCLVCLAGGPGFPSATLGDLGGLADDFELVFLDARGTGDSEPPGDIRGYSLEHYVADVDELREHLGLAQLDLLGHSHGGFVAMHYAAEHPSCVRRLVLVATAPRFAPEYRKAVEAFWDRSGDPAFARGRAARARRFEGNWKDQVELVALFAEEAALSFSRPANAAWLVSILDQEPPNADPLRFFNQEIAPRFDLRAQLPLIQADTLVITGEHDYFGPAAADELARAIAGARSVVLPRAGHFVWIEAPERFREEVNRFLTA